MRGEQSVVLMIVSDSRSHRHERLSGEEVRVEIHYVSHCLFPATMKGLPPLETRGAARYGSVQLPTSKFEVVRTDDVERGRRAKLRVT